MNNLADMQICYGSCQMIGAASAFLSIKDAAVIFNSPRWCALTAERELKLPNLAYEERLYCTEAREDSLVYGVENSLQETLEEVFSEWQPAVVAVITSCSMSLIGDDIKAICQRYNSELQVIALDAGGLTGGFISGYEKAQLELLQLTDFTPEPEAKRVNILGASTAYPHWQGDLEEIKRLLKLCGIEVNIVLGVDNLSLDKLNSLGVAGLNVVVDASLGLAAAKWLQEKRQMDYLIASWPYGVEQTLSWLKKIITALAVEADWSVLKKEAEKLQKNIVEYCNWLEHNLDDCYIDQVVTSLPTARAEGLALAFYNSGIDLLRCKNIFLKAAVPGEAGYKQWQEVSEVPALAAGKIRLLLASERERFLFNDYLHTVYVNLDMPASRLYAFGQAYVGLNGWQNLIASICEQIYTLKAIQATRNL